MRLFIALNFPEEINKHLRYLQEQVMKIPWASLKRAGEFHLTLKFLGEVKDEKKEEVCDFLRNFRKLGTVCDCALTRVGVFKRSRFPSVIWVGLSIPEELMKWQYDLEEGFTGLGFEPEHRFSSHVTLARVKYTDSPQFADKVLGIAPAPLKCKFENFYLMRSYLSRQGARYEVVDEFPLV